MVRALSLKADDAEAIARDIVVTRDEPCVVTVANKSEVEIVLTIAALPGDVPLVEIPGVGSVSIEPVFVQALTEGRVYKYNIWQVGGPMLLFSGGVEIRNSIAPSGADFATTFLNNFGQSGGPSQVVVLTAAEYAALTPPDDDTIYMISEG